MKGITKRWVINTFGVILIILFIVIVVFAIVVQGFYYNNVYQILNGRSTELVNIFNTSSDFTETARDYVENFPDKEYMEIMVINSNGNVIITSTGFAPDNNQKMPDYDLALKDKENFGDWHGSLSSGENVMAVTRVISDKNNIPSGAIRYVVSLE